MPSPSAGTFYAVQQVGAYDDPNPEKRMTMEDVTVIEDKFMGDETKAWFAVYDGHGGRDVAAFTGQDLHKRFAEILKKTAASKRVEISQLDFAEVATLLEQAVHETDEECSKKTWGRYQGCTACFCYMDRTPVADAPLGRMWFTSVGDSRGVMGVVSEAGISAVRMTRDHKPTDPDELQRIQRAGGFVTNGRVLGIIAVSRSIGDHGMKTFIVSKPTINTYVIQREDTFFIIACDGVWDVVSDDEAAKTVFNSLRESGRANIAARALVDRAVELDTCDNVSALVAVLRGGEAAIGHVD